MAKSPLRLLLPRMRERERLCRDLLEGRVEERSEPHLERLLALVGERNAYYAPLVGRPASLCSLPPLTKRMIRENFGTLRTPGLAVRTYENSSGGSTGQPQTLIQDLVYDLWKSAAEAYYYRRFLDVQPETVRKVVLWGSIRDTLRQSDLKGSLVNWITKTTFVNTFEAGEAQWSRAIDLINETRPHFIKGYAVSLYHLARFARGRGLRLYSPRFVYSSAQTLEPHMRREIEEVFQAKVFDFYGSREVGPIAGECRSGRRHVLAFHNFVESLNGRLLVTNLHNFSMPLLRYDIGDMGSLGEGACPCGSRLPWLEKLAGRVTDHFVKPDGGLIHGGYFTRLFYFRDWVREFQINQLARDRVELRIVRDAAAHAPGRELAEIERKIRLVLGPACRVEWAFVDSIPPTAQGKHLYTRCLIPQSPANGERDTKE